MPLLFGTVAAADVESHISEGQTEMTLLLEEVGYGVAGGVAAGLLIGAIIVYAGHRDLIEGSWRQVIPAAGAVLAYGTAAALHGSGFIVTAIYLTVGLSVFAHGLTAAPLADRYARWIERHPRKAAAPMENIPVEVTRTSGLVQRSASAR